MNLQAVMKVRHEPPPSLHRVIAREYHCDGAVTTGPSTDFEIFVSGRQDCSQSEIPFSGAPISVVAPLHFSSGGAPPNSAQRTSARSHACLLHVLRGGPKPLSWGR